MTINTKTISSGYSELVLRLTIRYLVEMTDRANAKKADNGRDHIFLNDIPTVAITLGKQIRKAIAAHVFVGNWRWKNIVGV